MEIITNPTQDKIKKAAKALKDGHLVAFPTETVYGLGADATNENAISRIYSTKGRPSDHPLIVHIASMAMIKKWAIEVPDYAIKLAKEFWPGPMTLILKRSNLAKNFITGGQNNIGLRIPSNQVAISLLSEFEKLNGYGIAAPSANLYGAVSPTSFSDVIMEIGNKLSEEDIVIDGQPCEIGIESTIIDCLSAVPKIIRPGFVTSEMIMKKIKLKHCLVNPNTKIKHSGQNDSHYSPRAKVVINANPKPGDGFIALSNVPSPKDSVRLASPKNIEEFARILYSAYRKADLLSLDRILVILPEGNGLAVAVRERIEKSAG
jgi:L-threonylcarbamoyladenylate synthase